MGFDAGRIEATSHLDNSPFRQGLVELRRLGKEAEANPVNVPVKMDTAAAEGKLIRLEERIRRVSGEDITPNVDVQGLARANTELSVLEARVNRLSRGGGSVGGGSGGAGGGGFFGALGRAGNHAPGMMPLALGAAAPLVAPAAGLALGAGASLLTPTLAGGLGAGIFGAAALANIHKVTDQVTKLQKLTQQYDAATTNKQRAAVLAKEAALWKGLDPGQRAAVKNVQSLDASWDRFKKKLEPQSFGALAGAAKIANTGLKYLLPTAQAVGDEVVDLERRAEHAFKAPFWKQFFGDFLPGEAARSVDTFAVAFGHLLSGGAHLMQDFAPLGHDLENVVVRLTGKFDKWTQGQGPVKFVNWVEQHGPEAAKALEGLAHGLEGVGKGMGPIASVELKALTPILNFIGDLGDSHPAVITALGGGLLAVGGGLKAIQAAKGIGGAASAIKGLFGGSGGPGGRGGTPATPLYVKDVGGHLPGGNGLKHDAETAAKDAGAASTAARVAAGVSRFAGPVGVAALVGYGLAVPGPKLHPTQSQALQNDPIVMNNYKSLVAGYQQKHPGAIGMDGVTQEKLLAQAAQMAQGRVSRLNDSLDAEKSQLAKVRSQVAQLGPAYLRSLNALKGVPGVLNTAEQAALHGGFVIGDNLAKGITVGIEKNSGAVQFTGYKLVKGVLHVMKEAQASRSPSKITEQYGKWIAQGLALGFAGEMPQVEALFGKHTTGALNRIRTIAQSRLDSARQQLTSDRQTRSSYASGLSGQLSSGLNLTGAVGPSGNVGSLSAYLGNYSNSLGVFNKDLKLLQGKHLSPALLQMIAEAGPVTGLALAQAALAQGGISGLNKQYAGITSLSNSIGGTVANSLYGATIAHDERAVNLLQKLVTVLKNNPHEIAVAIDQVNRRGHHQTKVAPSRG